MNHDDKILIILSKISTCKQSTDYWAVTSEIKLTDDEFQAGIKGFFSN